MARTVDLGFSMARASIEGTESGELIPDLTLMEPESDESDARSMRLVGIEPLLQLKGLIEETLADLEMAQQDQRKGATNT